MTWQLAEAHAVFGKHSADRPFRATRCCTAMADGQPRTCSANVFLAQLALPQENRRTCNTINPSWPRTAVSDSRRT
jgi:hypothetical protein